MEKKYEKACPDCGKVCDVRGLYQHRLKAHGVGNKPKPVTLATTKLQCTLCAYVGKNEKGLSIHVKRMHEGNWSTKPERNKLAKVEEVVSHASNGEDTRDYRAEAAASFAAGRITEILGSIASQYDLPAKYFTALVLRVMGQAAKVW